MLVCRYFSDDNAVKTLQSLLFKVTNPNDLNDPFENSPYFKKSEEQEWECYLKEYSIIEEFYNLAHRQFGITKENFLKKWEASVRQKVQTGLMQTDVMKILDKEKNEFSKEYRILCVSDTTTIELHGDILMWAHYSNGHKGVKISFDTEKIAWNDLKIDRVDYSEDRVRLDPIKILKNDPKVKDDIKKALITKSPGWKYEQEYRWFIPVQKCELDTEKNIHFVKIPANAIISVDIGVKAKSEIKEKIMDLIKEIDFAHIKIRHAKIHETKFELNYETQKFT